MQSFPPEIVSPFTCIPIHMLILLSNVPQLSLDSRKCKLHLIILLRSNQHQRFCGNVMCLSWESAWTEQDSLSYASYPPHPHPPDQITKRKITQAYLLEVVIIIICLLTPFTHFSHPLSSASGSHQSFLCIYDLALFCIVFQVQHIRVIIGYLFFSEIISMWAKLLQIVTWKLQQRMHWWAFRLHTFF